MPSFHYFVALRSLLLFLHLCLRVEGTRRRDYLQTVREHDNAVGMVENFDPAQANPVRNITCIGHGLALELPMIGGFNPNQVSVHEICAKPQYNGGARGQHAGGYCYEPPFAPYTGVVAFDRSRAAEASPELQNERVLLSCLYRCYCNWGLTDVSIQPKGIWKGPQFDAQPQASSRTYEISLDLNDDFTTPQELKMGHQGSKKVDSLSVDTEPQLIREGKR